MWKIVDGTLLTYTPTNAAINGRSVLGFDFDSTLVEQKSGEKFPIDENDWKPLFCKENSPPSPNVNEKPFSEEDLKDIKNNGKLIRLKLKEQYDNGNMIVIFSNQSGISKGKLNIESVKSRFQQFMAYLNFPVWCYIATADDHYRKPSSLMWKTMISDFTEEITKNSLEKYGEPVNVEWDLKHCAYIGDAAGREKGWKLGKKKDFACSDRKFAMNSGINFFTPEEFFLKESHTTKYAVKGFNPTLYLAELKLIPKMEFDEKNITTDKCELVLLVGPPSCGKSTFSKKYYPNHIRINRDEIGSMQKCFKATKEAIKQGKSVIVDNLNGTKKARKEFISCAGNAPVKCIVFNVEKPLVMHLNMLRVKMTKGKTAKLPDVVYHTYFKYFEPPTAEEGISIVHEKVFYPTFEDETHKQLFLEINEY